MNINSIGVMSQKNCFCNQNKQNVAFGQINSTAKTAIHYVTSSLTPKDIASPNLRKTIDTITQKYDSGPNLKIDLNRFGNNVCAIICPSSHARYDQRLSKLIPTKAEPFFVPLNSDGKELMANVEAYAQTVEATLPKKAVEAIKVAKEALGITKASEEIEEKAAKVAPDLISRFFNIIKKHSVQPVLKKATQYA